LRSVRLEHYDAIGDGDHIVEAMAGNDPLSGPLATRSSTRSTPRTASGGGPVEQERWKLNRTRNRHGLLLAAGE
jgi:hypothetical protein